MNNLYTAAQCASYDNTISVKEKKRGNVGGKAKKAGKNIYKKSMPGLEPGIFCFVGRRLIHWATRTPVDVEEAIPHLNKHLFKNCVGYRISLYKPNSRRVSNPHSAGQYIIMESRIFCFVHRQRSGHTDRPAGRVGSARLHSMQKSKFKTANILTFWSLPSVLTRPLSGILSR